MQEYTINYYITRWISSVRRLQTMWGVLWVRPVQGVVPTLASPGSQSASDDGSYIYEFTGSQITALNSRRRQRRGCRQPARFTEESLWPTRPGYWPSSRAVNLWIGSQSRGWIGSAWNTPGTWRPHHTRPRQPRESAWQTLWKCTIVRPTLSLPDTARMRTGMGYLWRQIKRKSRPRVVWRPCCEKRIVWPHKEPPRWCGPNDRCHWHR